MKLEGLQLGISMISSTLAKVDFESTHPVEGGDRILCVGVKIVVEPGDENISEHTLSAIPLKAVLEGIATLMTVFSSDSEDEETKIIFEAFSPKQIELFKKLGILSSLLRSSSLTSEKESKDPSLVEEIIMAVDVLKQTLIDFSNPDLTSNSLDYEEPKD